LSLEVLHELRFQSLARHTLDALGVNGVREPEAILNHAIGQACIEIEDVEFTLEKLERHADPQLSQLVYVLHGIRMRLELVNECADLLASLLTPPQEAKSESGAASVDGGVS
jgi:hypothetical protein